jgi:predicted ATP-dependent endonuclease of OLD family
MKVQIENLGKLKKIEYEVGRLTILCGHNNTGKTYAMYALYGLLSYAQGYEDQIFGGGNKISREEVLIKKVTAVYENLDLSRFLVAPNRSEKRLGKKWEFDRHYQIPIEEVFSLLKLEAVWKIIAEHFNEIWLWDAVGVKNKTKLKSILMVERDQDILQYGLNHFLSLLDKRGFARICREKKMVNVVFNYKQKILNIICQDKVLNSNLIFLSEELVDVIVEFGIVLASLVYTRTFCNKVHISTVERSGISMFSDELTIAKNKFVTELLDNEKVTADDIRKITMNMKYATPVKDNIAFMGYECRKQTEQESFIVKKYPEIIALFKQIANGRYTVDEYGTIRHYPNKSKKSLTLSESSSAIRALSDLSFYLHQLAQRDDLLMIDEPELNLHPDNQRLMARLIAMLVNADIKVMMTTHSDYLVREFNTLIMMKNQKDKNPTKTNKLMKKYGYDNLALLTADQCRATFVKNNTHGNAEFTKINIDPFYGVITENFDRTIQNMQDIQDDLCFIK